MAIIMEGKKWILKKQYVKNCHRLDGIHFKKLLLWQKEKKWNSIFYNVTTSFPPHTTDFISGPSGSYDEALPHQFGFRTPRGAKHYEAQAW